MRSIATTLRWPPLAVLGWDVFPPLVDAISSDVKMGASLKNMNVKEGMSSKMDAINRNYAKVAAACSAGLGGECFSSSCGCYFFGC